MAGRFGRTLVTSDPWGSTTDDESKVLMQWCQHTLRTKKGTFPKDPDHGIDLPATLLAGLTKADRLSLPAMVKAALERGRKVDSATVDLIETPLGGGKVALAFRISVQPASGGAPVEFTHVLDDTLIQYLTKGV
jgi:hypothetical protein